MGEAALVVMSLAVLVAVMTIAFVVFVAVVRGRL